MTTDTSMTGRTCVVTGANTGIGKEIARNLARQGATVVIVARNVAKGDAAVAEIRQETGNQAVSLLSADLSDREEIARVLQQLHDGFPSIDVLVNNAGIRMGRRETTPEGYERTWATNVLGYHRLTMGLLDRIKASGSGRIISTASTFAFSLDLDDPQFERRRFNGFAAYAQSKLANQLWVQALAGHLAGTGTMVAAVHPGFVRSELARVDQGLAGFFSQLIHRFARTPQQGGDTPAWLASEPQHAGMEAAFWYERKRIPWASTDPAKVDRVWQLCEAAR
jgi:NAD(P)-dependent dehydrogenase (short-subunit alcohol dehydrogenase family)